ncbi:hypothetical protein DFH28DRAFT_1132384 [Melampsora americana]|nr:hypothetical protein DFH28DRAFT_1132384 [Melampsora americana]
MNSTSSASSSSSSTQPAEDYIQKLSQHIRYHESSLAAATLNSTLQPRRHASSSSLSPSSSSSSAWSSLSNLTHGFGLLNSTLSSSSSSNPLTLNLDPHHLYYLLLKFEEIGIRIGFNSNENSRPIDKSDTISLFSNLSNLSIGSTWWLGSSSSPNRAIKAISNLRSQTYDPD